MYFVYFHEGGHPTHTQHPPSRTGTRCVWGVSSDTPTVLKEIQTREIGIPRGKKGVEEHICSRSLLPSFTTCLLPLVRAGLPFRRTPEVQCVHPKQFLFLLHTRQTEQPLERYNTSNLHDLNHLLFCPKDGSSRGSVSVRPKSSFLL